MLVVFGAVATVGYADYAVDTISLGYLYVLPLALSAFVFRLRIVSDWCSSVSSSRTCWARLHTPAGNTLCETWGRWSAYVAVVVVWIGWWASACD